MAASEIRQTYRTDDANKRTSPSALAALSACLDLPSPREETFQAADGTRLRFVHWPAAAQNQQGTVVYLQGRTEFIEKTMETYALLHGSGFDVWTLDWRGQGLSTRPLADPEKGHVTDYQLYLDDLHRFLSDIVHLDDADGVKLLLAHSMGGHIGFRYLHDHPGRFDKAAFSAPMIDIGVNRPSLRMINGLLMRLGFGESYALSTGRFRPIHENPNDPRDNGVLEDYRRLIRSFEVLSSDAAKRMEVERLVREDPRLALGGPTAAWLDATFRSINLTWAQGYAEAIDTPVLIVGGGRDRVVVTSRQEAMAKRLPNGRFEAIDAAAHEILLECDDVRFAFFETLAAFADIRLKLPDIDMTTCVRR